MYSTNWIAIGRNMFRDMLTAEHRHRLAVLPVFRASRLGLVSCKCKHNARIWSTKSVQLNVSLFFIISRECEKFMLHSLSGADAALNYILQWNENERKCTIYSATRHWSNDTKQWNRQMRSLTATLLPLLLMKHSKVNQPNAKRMHGRPRQSTFVVQINVCNLFQKVQMKCGAPLKILLVKLFRAQIVSSFRWQNDNSNQAASPAIRAYKIAITRCSV